MFKKLGTCLVFIILTFFTYVNVSANPIEIKYQVEKNYPPFKFVNGSYLTGFDIEFGSLIFNSEDYKIEYSTDIWENVYARLKNGEIDTCGLLSITNERKKEIIYSEPVLKTHQALFTSKGRQGINLDNLRAFKVMVMKGSYSERVLKDTLGVDKYITYTDVSIALDELVEKRVDAIFGNREVINFTLLSKGIVGEVECLRTEKFNIDFAYGINKDKPELAEYINARIKSLKKSGVFEELYQKYFFDHSDYYKESLKQKWIAGFVIVAVLIFVLVVIIQRYIEFLRKRIRGATRELLKQKNFLNSIVDNANIMIVIWDMEGNLIKFNKFSEARTGFREEEVLGQKWFDVIIPRDIYNEMIDAFERIKKGELAVNHENPILCKDGRLIDILWNNSILYDASGNQEVVISTGVDITDRKKTERKLMESFEALEAAHEELSATEEELKSNYFELQKSRDALSESEERYRLAVEGSNDALWDFDVLTNRLFISARGKQIAGYSKDEELENEMFIELIHPDDKAKYLQYMRSFFTGKEKSAQLEYRIISQDGNTVWVLSRGKGIWDSSGKLVRVAGSFMDITIRKEAEREIHQLAYYDTLTHLPNRVLLIDRLNMVLAESKRNKNMGALLYLDLDNFKTINDTQGHAFGDELLKKISDKLKYCVREYDTVARLGGDEFVILQPRINAADDAVRLAGRIISAIQEPWVISGRDYYITCSIGITIYPNDGKDGPTLLKNADMAMYTAKELGRNNYQLYEKNMNVRIMEKLVMENDMRRAIDRNEFVVFYQPQIDIATGAITGVEALIRWVHPEHGMIPPLKFIPLAEETGLVITIGEWVLRTACKQNRKWRSEGIENLNMAVNLSARQFQQKDLVEMISRVLEETGMTPELLELEITESIAMQDLNYTMTVLNSLRDMGIRVSLDDFGTGYSSLNYLKNLPISTLKIDKHFVQEITNNSKEEAIAKAVISMAHSMMLSVTAEGVETVDQLTFLKEQGCDKVQGYFFSKPLPAEELEALLKQDRILHP
ncbi:MAG: EAL domain-containing protein [Clostridia bacterium]|nr:EAL domain-containing protein [Clostridia bacterium]